jgi:hypothetical protein
VTITIDHRAAPRLQQRLATILHLVQLPLILLLIGALAYYVYVVSTLHNTISRQKADMLVQHAIAEQQRVASTREIGLLQSDIDQLHQLDVEVRTMAVNGKSQVTYWCTASIGETVLHMRTLSPHEQNVLIGRCTDVGARVGNAVLAQIAQKIDQSERRMDALKSVARVRAPASKLRQ